VRAVNFHATPERLAGPLEEQLSRLAAAFAPVSYGDLVRLVEIGEWRHDRPGVILNFFDGFRDNFGVVAPILDRLGMVGWFFVVSGWITTPPEDQRSFARRHMIDLPYHEEDLPADGRIALSPEELRDLAERGHVVASHTRTHMSASPGASPSLSPAVLEREAAASKRDLEEIVGHPVGALAWLEGAALGANAAADEAVTRAGYGLLFANHAVQRVP
jgi:peptidoglycan/xylan/chitin deacetylase (PgdA/CDA1 family)